MRRAVAVAFSLSTASGTLAAQTAYYNTDAGRPLQIEDARAVERYALELQLAAVEISRHSFGLYEIELEPEVTYGILPRTQVEASLLMRRADRGRVYEVGLGGVRVGALHNLNIETSRVPALALSAEVLAPVGALAPATTHATVGALATRTFRAARVHLNGRYTFGDTISSERPHGVVTEVPRWLAGVSVDRAMPLRSILVAAEMLAERSLVPGHPATILDAGAGLRWQWSPSIAVDAGVRRHLTGDDRAWTVTFGAAYDIATRALFGSRYR